MSPISLHHLFLKYAGRFRQSAKHLNGMLNWRQRGNARWNCGNFSVITQWFDYEASQKRPARLNLATHPRRLEYEISITYSTE